MESDVGTYIKQVTGEAVLNRAAEAYGKEIDKRGATVAAAHFRGAFPAYWLADCLEAAERNEWPAPPMHLFSRRRTKGGKAPTDEAAPASAIGTEASASEAA